MLLLCTGADRGFQRQQGRMIDDEVVDLPPEQFGRPKAPAGTWASCIRIIDPVEVRFDATGSGLALMFMCSGENGERY